MSPEALAQLVNSGLDEKRAPLFATFEQARNVALYALGDLGHGQYRPNYVRFGALKDLVNGFETDVAVSPKRTQRKNGKQKDGPEPSAPYLRKHLRLDFDPELGPHIQVELGHGQDRKKYTFRWLGDETEFRKQLHASYQGVRRPETDGGL